jgi:hypothetical protein
MASLLVVLVMLGCAALLYFKGTFVKACVAIIISICASIVAFGYFEVLANLLVGYASSIAPWAQLLCFVLLFVLAFAILQTVAAQLMRQPVDFGFLPERIGRLVCGIFLGLILSGLLLTALAMAPLPNKYPYQRFDQRNPDAGDPSKTLFNADGFTTGWFSVVSKGSLSGKKSFAALHPAFVDQLFLNRHNISENIPLMTGSEAIQVQKKNGAWYAPDSITDSDGKPLAPKSGHNLMIVRLGFNRSALKDASTFTPSQLRLICKSKTDADNPVAGTGENVYPIGYLKSANQLQTKRLNERITIGQLERDARVKWIDFAFYVPTDSVPVLAEFKLNNVADVPKPVSADQAPAAVPFVEAPDSEKDTASTDKPSQRRERRPETPARRGRLSPPSRSILGDEFQE